MANEKFIDLKKLQKENEKLRKKIDNILKIYSIDYDSNDVWKLVNDLIENELQQEELCNEPEENEPNE